VNPRKVESASKGGVALAGRLYIAFNPVTLNVTFDKREMVMRPALLFPFFSTRGGHFAFLVRKCNYFAAAAAGVSLSAPPLCFAPLIVLLYKRQSRIHSDAN
jgi:hypothetical protein